MSSFDLLTTPDGPFPIIERQVNGMLVQVFDRDPRTLRDVFLSTRLFGGRDAMLYREQRWTFDEQWAVVVRLAHALRDRFDVQQGDHVAIAMRNYPEWVFAFWATQLIGAVAVPLNAWLTGPELAQLVGHSEPKVLFADQERLARLAETGTTVPAIISVRARPQADAVPFEALVTDGSIEPPDCAISDEDIATIVYTSGTTSHPKGVVGTHLNHLASLLNRYVRAVAASATTPGVEPPRESLPAKTKLMTYPLFHVAGLGTISAAAFSGHTIILMYKWDVAEAVRIVQAEKVAEASGPPLVIQQIVEAAEHSLDALSSLRVLGCGGASAPVKLLTDIERIFKGRVSPTTGYGLTETTGGIISINGADFLKYPDSIGHPLPTVELRLCGEDGSEVQPGAPGELTVRSPQVMRRYHRDPEATRNALVDGWFHTGDLAAIDAEGRVRLVGRIKDIVIRGGENIQCAQVEARILEHPDVVEAGVFGLPHPTLGEELAAAARLREGSQLDAETLRQFVAETLAAFKVPSKMFIVVEALPRTASGKLLKRALTAAFEPPKAG